jgi:hypothetical protein
LTLANTGAAGDASDEAAKPRQDPYARVSLDGLKTDCFLKRAANNWTVLDRTRLIVYEAGKSRAFLVEISPPSFRLRSASTIAFVSNNSRVCGYAGERVLIGDDPAGGFMITSILRLDEARRDELLAVRKEIRANAKAARDADDESGDPPATSESGN